MKTEVKLVKKIGVLSLAKIATLFGVLVGLYYGIMFGMYSNTNTMGFSETLTYAQQYFTQDPQAGIAITLIAFGWWNLIIMPIILALGYFISGAVIALLFNLFTRYIGGVKLFVE